jgi:exopolyphosphatase/guanosine-5'-triphosphate,3'-diphosphate pyrophosphatase
MRIAIIDMGTNTFHLMLVELSYEQFTIFRREKIAVKIGEKGINHGFITAEAADRAVLALKAFQNIILEEEIDQTFATATSAIRNAQNGQELLNKIESVTGIKGRIISGLEEAEHIYFGVTKALNIGEKPGLIMDIGGGSIEFIIGNDKDISWMQSFEIGGQRMLERNKISDPITESEIKNLERYLFEHLQELFEACAKFQPETLIGSSGTFDTLSEIYQKEKGINASSGKTEFPFDFDSFESIFQQIITKKREERLQIPGMIPMRVDMIVVALILVNFVIECLNIKDLRISAYALKEGVLLKTIDSLKKNETLKP